MVLGVVSTRAVPLVLVAGRRVVAQSVPVALQWKRDRVLRRRVAATRGTAATVAGVRLITIPISHYCERARWALQRAGVDFIEEQHLQMLHLERGLLMDMQQGHLI